MGAGKGWSDKETVGACRAFITASDDGLRGNGKKKEKFYSQVLAEFNRLKRMSDSVFKNSDRTWEAIVQRFKKARCECLKLEGIMMSINRKPTGSPSDDNIMRAATAIYNGEGTIANMYSYFNDKELSYGVCFSFVLTLTYLRTTQTWKLICLSKARKVSCAESVGARNEGGGAVGQEERVNYMETVGRDQEEGGECGAVLIAGSSSSGVDVVVNNDTQPTRPVGVKKSQTARELAKRNVAIA